MAETHHHTWETLYEVYDPADSVPRATTWDEATKTAVPGAPLEGQPVGHEKPERVLLCSGCGERKTEPLTTKEIQDGLARMGRST